MPIYEFYCRDCHLVLSFFVSPGSARKKPICPHCDREKLEKRPSRFAFVSASSEEGEDDDDDLFGGLDENRLEGAMEALAGDFERMGDTEDPRAMGQLFRKFSDLTGLELGGRMQEALQRMEKGEDLDEIESDLDLDGEGDEDLEDFFRIKKKMQRRRERPRVDETLYFL